MKSYDFETEGKNLSERSAVPLFDKAQLSNNTDLADYLLHNDVISNSLYPEVHTKFL
jgi:hypothetical protein